MTDERDAWLEEAGQELSRLGHRVSAGRTAVLETLADADCLLSAQELALRLQDAGRHVSPATIYRALSTLHAAGLVRRIDPGDGSARYEVADLSGAHHHHLVCERCGAVLPFTDAALQTALSGLSDRLQRRVTGHEVTLRGPCFEACGQRR